MRSITICGVLLLAICNSMGDGSPTEQLIARIEALERQGLSLQVQLQQQRRDFNVKELQLLSKIKHLEEHTKQQDEKTSHLQTRVVELDGIVKRELSEKAEQSNTIVRLEKRVTALEDIRREGSKVVHGAGNHQLDKPKEEDAIPRRIYGKTKNVHVYSTGPWSKAIKTKHNTVNRQARLIVDPEQPAAFHALLGGFEDPHLGLHQNIKFDKVLENIGSAYHPQHGIFIAPQSGLYMFSATVLSTKINHSTFAAFIMKNGVTIGRLHGHGADGFHDQSSMTVVSQLQVADEVWVEVELADSYIWGDEYTSFAGALLYSI